MVQLPSGSVMFSLVFSVATRFEVFYIVIVLMLCSEL